MEEFLNDTEQPADCGAHDKRCDDFKHGVYQNGHKIHGPEAQTLCDAAGDGKHDEAHGVIQGHNGQQNAGKGTLGLVLVDDHYGCGGSGGSGNGAENQAGGHRQLLSQEKVEQQQGHVYKDGGSQRLDNGNDRGLTADGFQ